MRTSIISLLVRACLWPLRVAEARRNFRLLASFDARALADIGLAPQDLRDMTALPLWADPTEPLAARAAERAALALAARTGSRSPAAPDAPAYSKASTIPAHSASSEAR